MLMCSINTPFKVSSQKNLTFNHSSYVLFSLIFFLSVIWIVYTNMFTKAVENKIDFKVFIGFSNVKSRYMKMK